jgi:hypothetical protein
MRQLATGDVLFGPKKGHITRKWKKMTYVIGSFYKLYTIVKCSWGILIKEEEVNCSCSTNGMMANACSIFAC